MQPACPRTPPCPVSFTRPRADSEHRKLLRNSRCWCNSAFFFFFFSLKKKERKKKKRSAVQTHEDLNNRLRARRKGVGEMKNKNIYIFNNTERLGFLFLYIVNKCQNTPLKRGLVSCKYQVHVKRADSFDYFFSVFSLPGIAPSKGFS